MSDWADNTFAPGDQNASVFTPADTTPAVDTQPQQTDTTPTSDPLNLYTSDVANYFNLGGVPNGAAAAAASSGIDVSGAGPVKMQPDKSFITDVLEKARSIFGFDTDPTNKDPTKNDFAKLAMSGTMSAIGGMGQGYLATQKMKQERELYQQKLDIDRQLAQSQASIAQQKMQNQNLSGLSFVPPVSKGLIGQRVGFNPTWKQA